MTYLNRFRTIVKVKHMFWVIYSLKKLEASQHCSK